MADTEHVQKLAAIIREVDGTHSKGAAALAESILDHPRFRAALALADGPAVPEGREPAAVTKQPSDAEQVLRLAAIIREVDGNHSKGAAALAESILDHPGFRAVLAHWGNPAPQPPEPGEVGVVVAWLRATGEGQPCLSDEGYARLTRAAELLERLASPACVVLKPSPELIEAFQDALPGRIEPLLEERHPAPVPVSERLPGPEDCDAEGRCWLLTVEDEYPQWRLHSIQGAQSGGAMIWVPVDSSPGVLVDCFYTSHWLPAHALPVPGQGEVE